MKLWKIRSDTISTRHLDVIGDVLHAGVLLCVVLWVGLDLVPRLFADHLVTAEILGSSAVRTVAFGVTFVVLLFATRLVYLQVDRRTGARP